MLIFQQAQTLLCFSLGLQEKEKSHLGDKVTAAFTTHPEKPRNAFKTCSCRKAGGTHSIGRFFRSDFGFVLLWLPRKFFLLREFYHTAYFLVWAKKIKRLQNVSMLSILCYYLFYLLLVRLHHTEVFAELLSPLHLFQSAQGKT